MAANTNNSASENTPITATVTTSSFQDNGSINTLGSEINRNVM